MQKVGIFNIYVVNCVLKTFAQSLFMSNCNIICLAISTFSTLGC